MTSEIALRELKDIEVKTSADYADSLRNTYCRNNGYERENAAKKSTSNCVRIIPRRNTAQGLVEIDLSQRTNTDQVVQQAQDFCDLGLSVHGGRMLSEMEIFNLIGS
ncbi:Uncharacterised protein [Yersinia enterocolitica]|nr:Uncharacterised protein [Yersinia mollaretii]CNK20182.1 Uncharacterised protein [Yersinia enterocolitica]CQQ61958.1 Uncharacterised protein [Yersinia mollaretii]